MSKRMNKNKQEEIEADKQNRRNNRLSTIVAILAVWGTLCVTLFRFTRQKFVIWPEQGYTYYILMWGICIIPLAGMILIFWDIVRYVVADLNRYNLRNPYYKELDEKSDERYEILTNDFKSMLGILIFWVGFSGIVFALTSYFLKDIFINCMVVGSICLIIILLRKKNLQKSCNCDKGEKHGQSTMCRSKTE